MDTLFVIGVLMLPIWLDFVMSKGYTTEEFLTLSLAWAFNMVGTVLSAYSISNGLAGPVQALLQG